MPTATKSERAEKEKAKQRARAWQIAQVEAGLCPICATPAARVCRNKECRKYRKPVADKECSCGSRTEAMRLCLTHLENDRLYRERNRK